MNLTIGSSCQNFWIPVSRTGMTKKEPPEQKSYSHLNDN
ncbi:MAG: WPE palindromic element domain-containing protein [Wolbachia sp.]